MLVGDIGDTFYIKNTHIGVGECLAKHEFGVRTERCCPLLVAGILVNKGDFHAHLREGYTKEVVCTAVYTGGGDHVVARLADIEACKEVCCLTRGCQHSRHATFHSSNLRCGGVVRRILQTGVEITALFKVKETAHLFAGLVLECSALNDRHLARFSLAWVITGLHAQRVNM